MRQANAAPQPVPAEPAVQPTKAAPAFHERSLLAEGLAAAFRIEAGAGWATGTLPGGSGENEVARFLGEAMSLAKQMQAAMGGGQPGAESAAVEILIADPDAGPSRQSAINVSLGSSDGTVVTLQPGGGGHLVAMLQHFLVALNPAPRDSARA